MIIWTHGQAYLRSYLSVSESEDHVLTWYVFLILGSSVSLQWWLSLLWYKQKGSIQMQIKEKKTYSQIDAFCMPRLWIKQVAEFADIASYLIIPGINKSFWQTIFLLNTPLNHIKSFLVHFEDQNKCTGIVLLSLGFLHQRRWIWYCNFLALLHLYIFYSIEHKTIIIGSN